MTNLIVISNEVDVDHEASLVNSLFYEGLELFHLRKPQWKIEDQRTFLEKINPEFLTKVSVHQHHETISEFGLKYYHVKENERINNVSWSTVGNREDSIRYSTSFHNYNDLQFESIFWDYCFLSPVFDSISKPDYKSIFEKNFNIDGDLNQRVFALGGITKNKIDLVFKKEFFGVAIVGAIWNNPKNAIENFKEINMLCKQNVHTF